MHQLETFEYITDRESNLFALEFMPTVLNVLFIWASLNSYFIVNFGLKSIAAAGFEWLNVLEIIQISFFEWLLIMGFSAGLVILLRLIGRMNLGNLALALFMVGLVVLSRRFSACAFSGDDQAFTALLLDQETTALHCLYYSIINGVMISFKIGYFVLGFWVIRLLVTRLLGNRVKA